MRLALGLLCVCVFLSGLSRTADVPPPSIGAPVDSLKASELHDSFNEIHHGHRHEAIDIMRPRGTPILAVADGSIRKLPLSVQGGITIYEFDSAGTYCFYYAHLSQYAAGLHEGMAISRGDVIGYVGTTGNARPRKRRSSHSQSTGSRQIKAGGKASRLIPIQMLLRAIAGNSVWVLQDLRMPVRRQYLFKRSQRRPILRELFLQRGARRAGEPRDGLLVLVDNLLGILQAPLDDAGIALTHGDAYVQRGSIEESPKAPASFFARLLSLAAQACTLQIEFIGVAPAPRFLLIEKLDQLFLADIRRRSAIAFCAIHADLDEVIQGFDSVITRCAVPCSSREAIGAAILFVFVRWTILFITVG